jgi:hypothetical protein
MDHGVRVAGAGGAGFGGPKSVGFCLLQHGAACSMPLGYYRTPGQIPFEQKEPDYLLWAPLRSSFASSSTPAGCLLQLEHGLDEGARGAKSGCKN